MLPIPISHPSNPQTPEKHAPPPLQSLSEETAVLS